MIEIRAARVVVEHEFNEVNSSVLMRHKYLLFFVEHPFEERQLFLNRYNLFAVPFPIASHKYHYAFQILVCSMNSKQSGIQREFNALDHIHLNGELPVS